MLSPETIQKLSQLLCFVAEQELAIEELRQSICSQPDFFPYLAFKYLDADNCGSLNPLRLSKLCNLDKTEFHFLYKYYGDELTFREFLQMVLPCDDSDLRATASQIECDPYIPTTE